MKIKEKVIKIFKEFGIENPKVKYTKNYTSIGGCSNRGVIYLSLPFLLHNTDSAIKGLIGHEIAHLQHFNHGTKFKKLAKEFGFNEKEFVTISKYVIMCPRCKEYARLNKIPKGKIPLCKKCEAKGITQQIMIYKHEL